VAIPTFDGRELLDVLLPSLAGQRFRDFGVLVVDDGSTDGTAGWLAAEWPEVRLVAHPENRGVTAALNTCLVEPGTELVLLLNNDMELDPACLAELVGALDRHPEAGTAAPKLLDFHDRGRLDGAGDVMTWGGHGHRRGHGEPDDGRYDTPEEIFGACGGAMLLRRGAIDDVGPFDADFHALFEDVDWALRARLAGWGCRYAPTALAYHVGSATIGAGLSDFARLRLWRNIVWLVVKGWPASTIARHLPQLLGYQLLTVAVAARDRRLGVWLAAWRQAVAGLPRMLVRRRAIQRARRVTPRELERHLGPRG
jgi:GT2 family glycosyltransferase